MRLSSLLSSPRLSRERVVGVPAGSRIYAVGDIHGRADLLDRLLSMIETDADASAAARRVVVFLGDYVDRGADSPGVLDRLVAGPPKGFDWIFLRGNHEEIMLSFLVDRSLGPAWMRNGGTETLLSYVGPHADLSDLPGLQRALLAALPERHLAFLRDLPLTHEEGDYLFAHAGIRPGVPLHRQTAEDLLWIRGDFLNSRADHGKVVVHGHTVEGEPVVRANRIGIDTGAYASGRLTALVLEGTQRSFLQT